MCCVCFSYQYFLITCLTSIFNTYVTDDLIHHTVTHPPSISHPSDVISIGYEPIPSYLSPLSPQAITLTLMSSCYPFRHSTLQFALNRYKTKGDGRTTRTRSRSRTSIFQHASTPPHPSARFVLAGTTASPKSECLLLNTIYSYSFTAIMNR